MSPDDTAMDVDDLQEELEEEREEPVSVDKEKGVSAVGRMYRGETSFDFVGRRKFWFALSAAIIIAGMASLGVRGLNLGIQFKGGTAWTIRTNALSQTQAETLVTKAGLSAPTVEVLGNAGARTIEVQADLNNLSTAKKTSISNAVQDALATAAHLSPSKVSITHVGPTWGSQVTKKAVIALILFLILVAVYISFRFEPKMAIAAFVAMIHDLLVTVGVFSLTGFQVSPDTVIAVLTILGYSLYDTVVVFTRVRDNTKGFGASGRMTYSEMINLSMNQTLARSINTSLVAIIPVLSVLIIGAEILGATTLQNYGLALTVGLLSGAYSSIFIAAPVLSMLKEREARYIAIRQRLASRGDRAGLLTPAAAAALVGASSGPGGRSASGGGTSKAARAGTIRPGSAAATRPGGKSAAAPVRSGGSTGPAAARRQAPGASGSRPAPRPRKGGGKGKKRR